MRIRLLLLLQIIFTSTFATPQNPDRLIYNGDSLWFGSFPLETLREKNDTINKRLNSVILSNYSTCWRGYTGTWKIINDSLFLTELKNFDTKEKIKLDFIFGKSKLTSKGIYAKWCTTKITSGYGTRIGNDVFLEGPIYTGEFSCYIREGKVLSAKVEYKEQIEIDSLLKAEKEAKDTMIYMVIDTPPMLIADNRTYKLSEINSFVNKRAKNIGLNIDCEKPLYFSLLIEKDGTAQKIRPLNESNPFCDKEAMRIIKEMRDWEPGKHNGEIVRTRITIRTWKKE